MSYFLTLGVSAGVGTGPVDLSTRMAFESCVGRDATASAFSAAAESVGLRSSLFSAPSNLSESFVLSGDWLSITAMAFFALADEVGGSASSSELLQPSESASSSACYLTALYASIMISFRRFLLSSSFLHSQKAFSAYLPTFMRSPQLKCWPAR